MVDIHTHILPELDDGSASMAESVAMARLSVAEGVTHLFATPHHVNFTRVTRAQVKNRVAALQRKLDQEKISLTVLPGYEVHLYEGTLRDWDNELAGPLGESRYLLAEPPFQRYDFRIEYILFEFFERGFIPILAHPERIRPLQRSLNLLEPFLERGGLTQLTANSLTASPYAPARKIAEKMILEGMAHIISSDAHGVSYRKPELQAGVMTASKLIGSEKAEAMVTTTPMAVVNNTKPAW